MPNYVTTIIRCTENLKDKILNKDGFVDFNILIPMPPHSDTFFAEGNLGEEERSKYGRNNWYDWSIDHWGVKWNACNQHIWQEDGFCLIQFDTAWCVPHVWLDTLAKQGDFVAIYADEDVGNNCGIAEATDGVTYVQTDYSMSESDSLALAMYVLGYDEDSMMDLFVERYLEQDHVKYVHDNFREILQTLLPDGFPQK